MKKQKLGEDEERIGSPNLGENDSFMGWIYQSEVFEPPLGAV